MASTFKLIFLLIHLHTYSSQGKILCVTLVEIMAKCILNKSLWGVSHLGQAKLFDCNQIQGQVASQNWWLFLAMLLSIKKNFATWWVLMKNIQIKNYFCGFMILYYRLPWQFLHLLFNYWQLLQVPFRGVSWSFQ